MIDGEEGEAPLELEQVQEQPETGENGTGEGEVEDKAEEQSEAEEQPKKGKSVQERIDEITAARRDAERDAEYWRNRALAKEPEQQTEAEPENQRPNPADYEFGDADPNYWDALTEWKADQKINARLAELEQKQTIGRQLEQLETSYSQRLAAVREEIPDYDDVVTKTAARREWPCPPVVALAIMDSEVGPKVAHHLATNREEAIAISRLSPIEQAMAFGRLEAKFQNAPSVQAKIATDAPNPPQARTKGGQFASPGLDDRLSVDEWIAKRNKEARG